MARQNVIYILWNPVTTTIERVSISEEGKPDASVRSADVTGTTNAAFQTLVAAIKVDAAAVVQRGVDERAARAEIIARLRSEGKLTSGNVAAALAENP